MYEVRLFRLHDGPFEDISFIAFPSYFRDHGVWIFCSSHGVSFEGYNHLPMTTPLLGIENRRSNRSPDGTGGWEGWSYHDFEEAERVFLHFASQLRNFSILNHDLHKCFSAILPPGIYRTPSFYVPQAFL